MVALKRSICTRHITLDQVARPIAVLEANSRIPYGMTL
jgi:hypothetical protein